MVLISFVIAQWVVNFIMSFTSLKEALEQTNATKIILICEFYSQQTHKHTFDIYEHDIYEHLQELQEVNTKCKACTV